ncbi:MAG: phage holin family protein [Propionibacteriaceae bacterium]|jgi:hypothetical protein|nr:phage holin family protein [Propionibacteriaceae bacterium]
MPEITELIGSITTDARDIARGEIALTKEQLRPTWTAAKWDVKVLAAGAVLGLLGAIALTVTLSVGLAWLFSRAGLSLFASVFLGFLIVAVVFAGIGGPVALTRWRKVKAEARAAQAAVARTAKDTGEALSALHKGVAQGQELVESRGRRA